MTVALKLVKVKISLLSYTLLGIYKKLNFISQQIVSCYENLQYSLLTIQLGIIFQFISLTKYHLFTQFKVHKSVIYIIQFYSIKKLFNNTN